MMSKRILVITSFSLGGAVTFQSLYKLLKKRHRDVEIDVITADCLHSLIERMPEVRKVVKIPQWPEVKEMMGIENIRRRPLDPRRRPARSPLYLLNKSLLITIQAIKILLAKIYLYIKIISTALSLRGCYDQVIIHPQTYRVVLFAWLTKIPVRTSKFSSNLKFRLLRIFINDVRKIEKQYLAQVVENIYLERLPNEPYTEYHPNLAPKLRVDSANADACIKRLGLEAISYEQVPKTHPHTVGHGRSFNEAPILVLISSGTYGASISRIWPHRYFAEVANYYGTRGWRIWILGSKKEYQLSQRIVECADVKMHNLCGKTEISDAIDLLSRANLAISTDTGLMHVAAAVDCPVVVIYGAFRPAYCPPLTKRAKMLYHELPCSYCSKHICRYGHYRCLTEITPKAVIEAANDLYANVNMQEYIIR